MNLSDIQEWAATLPCRTYLAQNGLPYLKRYTISDQGSDVGRRYLQHFLKADEDFPHNHPWQWGRSIILHGSYVEEITAPGGQTHCRTLITGDRNVLAAETVHRLISVSKHCWTLIAVGPRVARPWEFLIPGRGLVSSSVRFAELGIPIDPAIATSPAVDSTPRPLTTGRDRP